MLNADFERAMTEIQRKANPSLFAERERALNRYPWVSVEKEMPEEGIFVIGIDKDNPFKALGVRYHGKSEFGEGGWYLTSNDELVPEPFHITHWMNIP